MYEDEDEGRNYENDVENDEAESSDQTVPKVLPATPPGQGIHAKPHVSKSACLACLWLFHAVV